MKRRQFVALSLIAALSVVGCNGKAAHISSKIASIGEVTAESLDELSEIEAEYQGLSDEEKESVTNHQKLSEALETSSRMKTDADFLSSLEDSVSNRLLSSGEEDYSSIVNAELARLNDFRNASFYDETVSEAAAKYICGIDKQKEALGKTEVYSEFQLLWDEGAIMRYEALGALNEALGFMDGNADFEASYILGLDDLNRRHEAMLAIEADIVAQTQEYIEASSPDGGYSFSFTLMNNTDYAFESVFEFDMLREDGTIIESVQTMVSPQPHSPYTVTAYVSDNSWVNFNYNNWYNNIYV